MADDPVRRRRAQIGRWAALFKRVGYLAIAGAFVFLILALLTGLAQWAVDGTVSCLIAATVVLPPAIIVSYGVAKAEREDPEGPG